MNNIKPLFLLAGGNFSSSKSMASLMAQALRECGGPKPRVACIGTASGDNALFFRAIKSLLHEAGAGEVLLIRLAKIKANIISAREALETADAVFLSGGEVDDGMRWLERHGLTGFLKELYRQGKLFFGISAGSIMMGAHWVRWRAPGDDSTAELFDCLGFAPAVFDTHAEDEGWKELKMTLKLKGPGACGYGIPKGCMAIVDSRGQITSLGKSLLCYMNNEGRVQRI